jgi:hypothetical protein
MESSRSSHLPGISGGIVTVTGEAIVDTELRYIKSFVPSFNMNNFVPDEESKLSWYALPGSQTQQIVIRVEKGGANDGLLGTNPVQISWLAIGE